MRCLPMTAKMKLGSPQSEDNMGLTDLCSNTGLIDYDLFAERHPDTMIHPMTSEVTGMGKRATVGFAVVPIWIEAIKDDASHATVEIDVELHITKDFPAKILLGLDAMLDYGIDLSMCDGTGHIPTPEGRLRFPLFTTPGGRFRNVRVKSAERVTIPANTAIAIAYKSPLAENMEYDFYPAMTVPRGLPPWPQLPNGVINRRKGLLWFLNQSEHPLVLEKGQDIGEAKAAMFGSKVVDTGLKIDFSNVTRPSQAPTSIHGTPPPHNRSPRSQH